MLVSCIPLPFLLFCNRFSNGHVFDVRHYGAVGDGLTDDTEAFEKAISAVAEAGGGTVVVPSKGSYSIRPINLTSSMEFYIQGGATITGNASTDAWPIISGAPSYGQGRSRSGPRYTSLLNGEHLANVTIRGDGNSSIVDGQGSFWWVQHKSLKHTRSHLVEFMYSTNIKVYSIAMKDSPFWNNHFFDCDGVHVQGVSVSADPDPPNTDGWDPDSSRNVLIECSWYSAGDDCVAIKSGWDCFGVAYGKPSVNITIRNLTCHGHLAGVAIGSEMSGGVENVTVSNIRFTRANGAAHIKTGPSRGGYVKHVRFEDLVVQGPVDNAILVDTFYKDRNPSCPKDWKPAAKPRMSNLTFVNIDGRIASVKYNTFHFRGPRVSPIDGVYLENVHFGEGQTQSDWYCSVVSGTVKNGTVEPWPPCEELKLTNQVSPLALVFV